jgi:carbonic anhydrase
MTKDKLLMAVFSVVSIFSPMAVELEGASYCCCSEHGWRSLEKGNQEFISDPDYLEQRAHTAHGQNPKYVVLSCADSRTPPELIFSKGLGKIFCPRVAGNTAEDQVIDSIAFAVKTWDVNTIVVLGHDNCGAVAGALEQLRKNNGQVDTPNGILNTVLIPIERAIVKADIDINSPNALKKAIEANVSYTAKRLLRKSDIISKALKNHQIVIVGAVYSLESGKIRKLFILKDGN